MVLSAAIILGLIGTLWQTIQAFKMEALADKRAEAAALARQAEELQRQVAEASRKDADAARIDSESRLARLYLERGLNRLDSEPHVGLPWLVEAMRIEPESSPGAFSHRLRIQSMIQELPKLLGFVPAEQPVFNEQNNQLAVIEDKTKVVLYALPSMKLIATLQHNLAVKRCYYSDKGDFLLTVCGEERGDRRIRLWSTQTGDPLSDSIDATEPDYLMKEVPFVRIAPDGQRFTVVWAGMYNRWLSRVVAKVLIERR